MKVPSTVARGMVRRGSMTSPAGTVADSIPRKANIVRGAVAASALKKGWPLGLSVSKLCQSTQKSPRTAIDMNGTSFVKVVATWKSPASLTPRRFTSAN